jgi:pimeloyl-ACP methyl ester carboxylesterase
VPRVRSGDGCPIHYRLHGPRTEATPLLLIPGWGCDGGSWGGLLERLSAVRTCVTVDNRGSGRSGPSRRPFGIGTMADDAVRVLEAAALARVDVVGNSLGGMVGQALALRHPERVRSLVLLSSSPGIGSIPCHPMGMGVILGQLAGRLRHLSATAPISGEGHTAPADLARRPAPRLSLAQFGATLGWFGLPVLRRIRVPTLIVHGTHDVVVPALNARLMARLIPGAELVLVAGAGHLILDTHADRVAAAISGFLGSLEPRPGAHGFPPTADAA